MSVSSAAVLGPGAVGGFIAALLWRSGIAVTCVAKDTMADEITQHGIEVDSPAFGRWVARPRAVASLDHAVDVLFVATKATTLEAALKRVDPARVAQATIVPLLNGIEHTERLRSRYGRRVVAGSIGKTELSRRSPTQIIHLNPLVKITLASDGDVGPSRVAEIEAMLTRAGIETEVLGSEAEVLWGKLVRLNALACAISASGRPLGEIRSDPWWRAQLEGCLNEGASVASAEGVQINVASEMEAIDRFSATLKTSMERDLEAGRAPELDAIAGAVVRAGARHGILCPVINDLIAKIQARMAQAGINPLNTAARHSRAAVT